MNGVFLIARSIFLLSILSETLFPFSRIAGRRVGKAFRARVIGLGVLLALPPAAMAGKPPSVESALAHNDYDEAARLAFETGASGELAASLSSLISRARELELAERPMWRVLLHYRKTLSGGWKSQVDAPYFFLSRQGKSNPVRELEATLAAFFSNSPKPPMRLSPRCRFVARRQWLTQALGEVAGQVPADPCPEYALYKRFFKTDALTVVFPSAHPNSPSSAFGHTLLRLDKRGQSPELRMLNQSLNFAAEVPEDVNPLSYVIGGMAGGFQGKFRFLPYHIKLREYGEVDNRDIWEYELNLDPGQIDRVLAHAYELLIAWFDYYFFRENCSYHLLSLLDVADPDMDLTRDFPLWAIPVDTLKALDRKGLVRERRFMPSMARKIRREQEALGPRLITVVDEVTNTEDPGVVEVLTRLTPVEQARVLDLAGDYRRYQRLNGGGAVNRLSPAERQLLKLRSKIPVATRDPEIRRPDAAPDQGHDVSRVEAGARQSRDGALYTLQYRPAYHDFLDPAAGYGDNTSIDFIAPTVAWPERGRPWLRRFTLLDIQSVEPRDHFFRPVSWRTRIAWEKPAKDQPAQVDLLGGAGLARRAGDDGPIGYVFAEGSLRRDRALDKSTTIVGGLRAGALWAPTRRLRGQVELTALRDFRNQWDLVSARLDISVAVNKNLAWVIGVIGEGRGIRAMRGDGRMALRWYF